LFNPEASVGEHKFGIVSFRVRHHGDEAERTLILARDDEISYFERANSKCVTTMTRRATKFAPHRGVPLHISGRAF